MNIVLPFGKIRKAVVAVVSAALIPKLTGWLGVDAGILGVLLDAVVVGVLVWVFPNAGNELEDA
jgi:hypothetical protein